MAEEALAALTAAAHRFRGPWIRAVLATLALAFACAAGATPPKKSPGWNELTPEQQQTLQPLAGEWETLDASRRSKWIGIAKRYPSMSANEQQRVQTRMADWVKLTPDQRRSAREQFRKIGKLPPEKRESVNQQWEEYQQLPADVKKNLAAENAKKKTEKLEPRNRSAAAKAKKPPAEVARPAAPPAPAPAPASAQSSAPSTVVPTKAN